MIPVSSILFSVTYPKITSILVTDFDDKNIVDQSRTENCHQQKFTEINGTQLFFRDQNISSVLDASRCFRRSCNTVATIFYRTEADWSSVSEEAAANDNQTKGSENKGAKDETSKTSE